MVNGKALMILPEVCTGCRLCELACSARHDRIFNPSKSRVKVIKRDDASLDVPMVCLQCSKPVCVDVCTTGALHRDQRTGAVVVDEDKCIGCRACVTACPLGGLSFDGQKGIAVKCDLCDGEPQCVKYCPTGALQYVRTEAVSMIRKRIGAERLSRSMRLVAAPSSE